MYPGGGSQQYPYGDGGQYGGVPSSGVPGQQPDPNRWPQQPDYGAPQQPAYGAPQQSYPPYDPNAYPQQPAYPQPGYDPNAYQQPAYPQPGYDPNAYQQPYPQPQYPAPAPPQRSGPGPALFIVAAVAIVAMLAVVGFAVYLVKNAGDNGDNGTPTANGSSGSGRNGSSAGGTRPPADPAAGMSAGSGPVKVDIYVDYQCPPCSTFEETTAETLNGYLASNKITLTIHPVAFIDERSKNKYSTRAAAAVECAYEQGKLVEFHTHLLNHQPPEDTAGPTDQELATAGTSLGMGEAFATCVTSGARTAWVGQATKAATSGGVNSVPSAYVNSKSVNATKAALDNAIATA